MNRMGWQDRISSLLKAPDVLYAVGQGALGLEIREGDERVKEVLKNAGDWKTEWSTAAERGLLRELEGGCSVPVGVETFLEEVSAEEAKSISRPFDKDPEQLPTTAPLLHQSGFGKTAVLHLKGCITSLDGKKQTTHDAGKIVIKSYSEASEWGHKVAKELRGKGGHEILKEIEEVRKEREEADKAILGK